MDGCVGLLVGQCHHIPNTLGGVVPLMEVVKQAPAQRRSPSVVALSSNQLAVQLLRPR